MLATIVNILVIIVLAIYIAKKWNEAREKRDVHDSLRVGAGVNINEKKSSIFPFLFK
jgi:predicted transporter